MSITIDSLKKAGLQYGYSRTRRHPSIKPFIEGTFNGTDFINLEKTKEQLETAISFLKSVQGAGKTILFIGVKPEVRQIIKEVALSLNAPYVAERFIGGTLTNFPQMKKRVEKLHDLLKKKETGELAVYTKKEQLLIQRDIDRLDRDFGGVSSLTNIPAAIVIVDPRHEAMCIKEANLLHIPVVALLNTDCSVDGVSYPVVGNDGGVVPVRFFLEAIKSELSVQA
ncbi:MAG: ribosomal protein small subunit ribosomal protein [Candidatus Parcubacteria bacterium]|jgi:small subunit ribosomal protein S2